MNTIYNKLRSKRRYRKTPPCGHLDGFCSYDTCRMQYAISAPTGKFPPLDKTFRHRDKVVKILRAKEFQKLDADNTYYPNPKGMVMDNFSEITINYYQGEYSKQKARQARYEKWAWIALWVLCGFVLLISIFL